MLKIQTDINVGEAPILATAIHNGHEVRPDVARHLYIDEFERMREEDPSTGYFTNIAPSRLIVNTSRFEVDVNRPKETAIYKTLDQSWGLKVWREGVPGNIWQKSLQEYDEFYMLLNNIVDQFLEQWGYLIVLDIHSYNYKRENNEANPAQNPDINLGTASMDRTYWAPVVDYFSDQLSSSKYFKSRLHVDENVRFKGGYMGNWLHDKYPRQCCVLSIELKKIFMDEWTGATDLKSIKAIKRILSGAAKGIMERAESLKRQE